MENNINKVNQVITYRDENNAQNNPNLDTNTQNNTINNEINDTQNSTYETSNKRKWFLILGGIIIAVIIIVIVILVIHHDEDDKKVIDEEIKDENEYQLYTTNSGEYIVAKINRTINQMWKYDGNENLTVTNIIDDSNSLRRNEEIIKNIKTEYLLNIYDEEILSDNSTLYSAYAMILNKIKIENNEEFYEGGINILEIGINENNNNNEEEEEKGEKEESELINENEEKDDEDNYNNDIPIIKFRFYENGTLYDMQKPKNISSSLFLSLKTFVDKVIPSVSHSLYSYNSEDKLRILNQDGIFNDFSKKDNKIILNENRDHGVMLNDFDLDNSNLKSDRKIEIDLEGNIKNIKSNQISKISSEGIFDEECEDTICPEDKEDNIPEFPIRSISTSSSSNIDLKYTNINKTIAQTINKYIIPDIVFENYNIELYNINNRRRRRLNEKIINNKKLINRRLDIGSFSQPMRFSHPVFKTNIGGIKIGMTASIKYIPAIGDLKTQLNYKIGNNETKVVNIQTNTTIGYAYDKFKEVIEVLGGELYYISNKLIRTSFSSNWKKQIIKELSNISTYITNLYDATPILVKPLNNLVKEIRESSKTNFDKVYLEINKSENNLNILKTEVDNIKEVNEIALIAESKINFNSLVSNYKETFDLFDESTIIFTDNIIESLPDLKYIDIGSFYDIKEQLSSSEIIYNQFEEMVKNAINSQNILLNDYTNTLSKNNLERIIEQLEYIAKRLQTNATLIEAINDNNKRNKMIMSLNSIRTKVNNIIKTTLNKIDNIYKELNNENVGELKSIISDAKNKKNIFLKNKDTIEKKLRSYISVSTNFELYIEDTDIIFTIDQKVTNTRAKQFFNEIIIPLSSLEKSYLNSFNDIENNVNSIINEVLKNKNNNFNNIPSLLEILNTNINKSITNSLGDQLIKNIYNSYKNKTYLDNQLKLYYQPVLEAFNEYSTVFREKYFLNHIEQYVDKPYEIQTKIGQIHDKQNKMINIMLNDTTKEIKKIINQKISETYDLYKTKIQQYFIKIQKNIPKDNYNTISTNNINSIYNTFNNILKKVEENKINSLQYENQKRVMKITNEEDPFNIKEIIKSNENSMLTLIKRIVGYVQTDFDFIFCEYNNNNECIYKEKLDATQKKLFQNAKLRYTISKLNEVISLSKNSESFNLLSFNKYIELFQLNTDYNKDYISNSISNSFKDLNIESQNLINPTINSFKNNLTNSFETNINQGLIESTINKLINKIFILPTTNIDDKAEKVKNTIINAFNEYKNLFNNKKIFVERNSLEESYINLKNLINNTISQNIGYLNTLKIDNNLINQVIKYYCDIIDKIGKSFEDDIIKYSKIFPDYNLLGLTFNIGKISNQANQEEINKLKTIIQQTVKQLFNSGFNNQISNIKLILTKYNDRILDTIKEEYETIFKDFTLRAESESDIGTIIINSLSPKLNNNIINEANKYFEASKQIYNSNTLSSFNLQNKNDNIEILDILTYNFPELHEKITKGAETLNNFCIDRFEKEKILFKDTIEKVIIEGYNKTIKDFSNSFGKNYLDKILVQITSNKVEFNLNNIETTIKYNHQFLMNILKSITSYHESIGNSLKNIYSTLTTEISNNLDYDINTSLTNVIDDFKLNSKNKITELYIYQMILTLNDNEFKKYFTQNVINLLPNQFNDAFINKLINNYNELVDYNNLDQFKSSITSKFNELKNTISKLFKTYKNEIEVELSKMTSITLTQEIKYIISSLKNYKTKDYEVYPKSFTFIISDKSKTILNTFINKIKSIISPIMSEYIGNDDKIKKELQDKLNSFGDYFSIVKSNLNTNDIISKTLQSLNNLKELQKEIKNYILEEVDNIDNELKNIDISIFKKRNLEIFEIGDILDYFDKLKNAFNTMQQNSTSLNEYIQFSKDSSDFDSLMKNMINHISDPIENALNNLFDYLSESQYKSFELNIKTQVENIKQYLLDFYNIENQYVYNSNNIIKGLGSLYNSIKDQIKSKTDNYLTIYSNKIFQQIKPINIDSKLLTETKGLELGSFSQDILGTKITFKSSIPKYNYKYLIKFKYENFELITYSELLGESEINVKYETGDIKAGMKGMIGSGIVSMESNNKIKYYKNDLSTTHATNPTTYIKSISKKKSKRVCKKRSWWRRIFSSKWKCWTEYYWTYDEQKVNVLKSRISAKKKF